MKKRQLRTRGDVLRIDLSEDTHSYCRVLEEAVFGFYDRQATMQMALDEILRLSILFKIAVMDKAVTSG